jgi:hypothetical protein
MIDMNIIKDYFFSSLPNEIEIIDASSGLVSYSIDIHFFWFFVFAVLFCFFTFKLLRFFK